MSFWCSKTQRRLKWYYKYSTLFVTDDLVTMQIQRYALPVGALPSINTFKQLKLGDDFPVALPEDFQEGCCCGYIWEAPQNVAQIVVERHSLQKRTWFYPTEANQGWLSLCSSRYRIIEMVLLEDTLYFCFLSCLHLDMGKVKTHTHLYIHVRIYPIFIQFIVLKGCCRDNIK